MKRLLIVLITALPFVMCAQGNYEITNIRGNVTLLRDGAKKWEKARVFMSVSLNDVLSVPSGGEVEIHERSTGRIDVSSKSGKVSVQNRILDARKARQSTFATMHGELMKKIKKQNQTSRPMVSYAAVSRGENDTIIADLYDSIYANILYIEQNNIHSERKEFTVEKIHLGENSFSVRTTNNSDRLLYFNIVRMEEANIEVCYYLDGWDFIPIPAGEMIDLSPFPLLNSSGKYLVIFSENNLSNELLDATFQGKPVLSPCVQSRVWINDL